MNICQKERIFFFFTHAITILSLFTYSVCDEKVKIIRRSYMTKKSNKFSIVLFNMDQSIGGKDLL